MDLADHLSTECVLLRLEVADKWELLERLVARLVETPPLRSIQASPQALFDAIREREEKQSTAIGDGIAIPHARVPGLREIVIGLATPAAPLAFDSPDGRAVGIVWLMLVPEEEPTLAVQAYAKIVEFMRDDAVRLYVSAMNDPNEIHQYLRRRRIPVTGSVTARDIMMPPGPHIGSDTPLRQLVDVMRQNRLEAVAVEDDKQHLVGEITCDRLFQYGIPDFFNQLQCVAFIRNFDPFRRYFADEARAVAKDVMESSFAVLPPDATVLEIVFTLTVQRHPKVYIVEEGKWVGTLDRIEVLERILDF